LATRSNEKLRYQQQKTETLLLNILPKLIAQRLKQNPGIIADSFESVTVMFADIVGFTNLSAQISPLELVKLLNEIFSRFDALAQRHNLEKIKTIGDAYLVVGGLSIPNNRHLSAIADMALDMQQVIAQVQTPQGEPFQIRIGINCGLVVAGVIGQNKFIYDLWGTQ
jgi:class 3 adenylate cyclase